MTSHPQQVHTTRHLHPFFVVGVVGFFFVLIFVLFGNPWNKRTVQQDVRVTMQVPPQKNIIEPRFDRKPQEKVGPYRYTSEFMKISFDVPEGFLLQEKLILIVLASKADQILLSRSSTNYSNVMEYFSNLSIKNNYSSLNPTVEEVFLNNNKFLKVKFNGRTDNSILYLFYTKGDVYTFSTSNSSLDSTVQKIAESFKAN